MRYRLAVAVAGVLAVVALASVTAYAAETLTRPLPEILGDLYVTPETSCTIIPSPLNGPCTCVVGSKVVNGVVR